MVNFFFFYLFSAPAGSWRRQYMYRGKIGRKCWLESSLSINRIDTNPLIDHQIHCVIKSSFQCMMALEIASQSTQWKFPLLKFDVTNCWLSNFVKFSQVGNQSPDNIFNIVEEVDNLIVVVVLFLTPDALTLVSFARKSENRREKKSFVEK